MFGNAATTSPPAPLQCRGEEQKGRAISKGSLVVQPVDESATAKVKSSAMADVSQRIWLEMRSNVNQTNQTRLDKPKADY